MRYVLFFGMLGLTASFAACNNRDVSREKELNVDAVYFDYKITGDDESGEVTCLLQFHYGGPDKETLLLEAPSQVQLDDETLEADSAEQTGAYYEVRKPVEDFAGKHTITFTDLKGKKYTEAFQFTPFSFATDIGNVVKRSNLSLPVTGLKEGDKVRVILIDTSFATDDLNGLVTIQNGTVTITQRQLKNVANGPVTLQLFKEENREVKNGTKGGGMISITYGIKKEFELVD